MTKPTLLTNIKIKNLKPSEQEYTLSDGFNLYLLVKPNGAKLWRFIYVSPETGKRKKLSLGQFPYKSLLEAREDAQKFQKLLHDGICPFNQKQREEAQAIEEEKKAESLKSFAYKWADWKLSKGKFREDTKLKTMQRLENHLFPRFEGYKLNQFTITDSIEKLQDLEQVMPDTLYRILGSLIEIMDYAMLCGRIPHNPIAPIKKAFISVESTHQPTIEPRQLAEFMQTLQKSNRTPQGNHANMGRLCRTMQES